MYSIQFEWNHLLETIGDNAFYGINTDTNNNLELEFKGCYNLKTIGNRAFYGNNQSNIKSIKLTDTNNLESIGEEAFYYSKELLYLDLSGCFRLKTISKRDFRYDALDVARDRLHHAR